MKKYEYAWNAEYQQRRGKSRAATRAWLSEHGMLTTGNIRDAQRSVRIADERRAVFRRNFPRLVFGKHLRMEHFVQAGYPSYDFDKMDIHAWGQMHKTADAMFGRYGYVWFGSRFFFQTEEHKTIFLLVCI